MDILRAPWRMEYIDSSNRTDGQKKNIESGFVEIIANCIFCVYAADDKDEENLVLARGKSCYVIMNRYPYSVGHILIAPYRHTADLISLTDEEKLEILTLAQQSVSILQKTMNADGINIGMNLGRVAGAGIDTHLHLHVVPRWNGDINFMSVTAETKVLPEALSVTWLKIFEEWKKWDKL